MKKDRISHAKPISTDRVVFNIIAYVILGILAVCCLLPFLLVLSGSFSDQTSILTHGYQLIPETFSLDAYTTLFKIPGELLRAYAVTIFVTFTGTFLGLFLTSMAAYVLSSKSFRYRNQVSFSSTLPPFLAAAWFPGIFSTPNICTSTTASSR